MAGAIKPDPDPTVITTKNLLREIKHLRKLMQARVASIEARLDHKYIETADAVENLSKLTEEKFKGLNALMTLAREDAKTLLDAAFKSANDTRDKIEESVNSKIEAVSSRSEAANTATNEKIDRLTSRVDQGGGRDLGVEHARQERTVDKGQTLTIISLLISLTAVASTIFLAVTRH